MVDEQISNLVTRFNLLEKEQEVLSKDILDRDELLFRLRLSVFEEVKFIHKQIDELEVLVSKLEMLKKDLSGGFKNMVKKDALVGVEQKINRIGFEGLLTRDELFRIK